MRYEQSAAYVPAVQPEAPVVQRTVKTVGHVMADLVENIFAGIGAGIAICAVAYLAWGALYNLTWVGAAWPDPVTVWFVALLIAAIVAGGLCAMRFGADEFIERMDWNATLRTLAELQAECEDAQDDAREQRRLRLVAENRADVAEFHLTQRKPQNFTPAAVTLGSEWDGARELIVRKFDGRGWARDSLVVPSDPDGWKQKEWQDAMDVLARCGVVVKVKNAWTLWDKAATIEDALSVYDEQKQAAIRSLERSGRVGGTPG